jgi:hypothetical protein
MSKMQARTGGKLYMASVQTEKYVGCSYFGFLSEAILTLLYRLRRCDVPAWRYLVACSGIERDLWKE